MRRLVFALLLLPGCVVAGRGCYLEMPMTRTRVDAGASGGTHWELVEGSLVELTVERCELREGATAILHLRSTMGLCDEPANVRWSVDHGARRVTLRPAIWRPVGGPACAPGRQTFERDVFLEREVLEAGAWQALLEDGSAAVAFTVAPGPTDPTCTACRSAGESCSIDQECPPWLRCVPMRGDGACASICALPCNPFPSEPLPDGRAPTDLGCTRMLGPSTCEDDPSYGPLCRAATGDLCPACPEGMTCNDGAAYAACEWNAGLERVGDTCATDADCPAGTSCIEVVDGVLACMVRCRSDHPCPGGREGPYCDPGSAWCSVLVGP